MLARLLAFAAVLLLGLLAWLLQGELAPRESEAAELASGQRSMDPPTAPEPPGVEFAVEEPPGAQAAPVETGSAPAPAGAEAPAPIRGRATLLLEDGATLGDGSGLLRLVTIRGVRTQVREVEVVDGRFELLPLEWAIEEVQLDYGTLGERSVVAVRVAGELEAARHRVESDEVEVLCRVRGPLVLDVRDAATDLPLDGVELARTAGFDSVPGPDAERLLRGAASPVELDPNLAERAGGSLVVGASGFAWQAVALDLAGDRRAVRLEPGGALTLTVEGVGEAEGLRLAIRDGFGSGMFGQRLDGGTVLRLDGLPAGRVEALVQRVEGLPEPRVFGSVAGSIVPGERLDLRLLVDAAASTPIPRHGLTVEVLVPPAWDLEHLELQLARVDAHGNRGPSDTTLASHEAAVDPTGRQRFRFELGPRPAGLWAVDLEPCGYSGQLAFDGPQLQRIELPPPAEVTVDVIDARTGLPVSAERLLWCSVSDDGSLPGNPRPPDPVEGEPGRYVLRAPVGRIALFFVDPALGETYAQHDLVPGHQRIELPVGSRSRLELRLMDGDTNATPQDSAWSPRLTRVDSDEQIETIGERSSGRWVILDLEPGGYVIAFPALEGFEPIPDRTIELPPGEVYELDIPVTRLP